MIFAIKLTVWVEAAVTGSQLNITESQNGLKTQKESFLRFACLAMSQLFHSSFCANTEAWLFCFNVSMCQATIKCSCTLGNCAEKNFVSSDSMAVEIKICQSSFFFSQYMAGNYQIKETLKL